MALRRDRATDAGWETLPLEGRPGDPPPWPLVEANEREDELWDKLWHTPQAVQWEKLGQQFQVALYVRRLGEAEMGGSPAALTTLVKQMADALGLTIPGMKVNRWKIATDQVAEQRAKKATKPVAVPAPPSARNRFRGQATG